MGIEVNIPEIPNFGSPEPITFGGTSARDPKSLLSDLQKSSEQLLWKRWARKSSGGPQATFRHINGAITSHLSNSSDNFSSCHCQKITEQSAGTSQVKKNRDRCLNVLEPPSPLNTGVCSHKIQSWVEKGSVDHSHSKPRRDECYFSLSSEEGIYSLSALDSDEEDAYSYILDLNKEVFQPYNHLKRVPRLEEETAGEMMLNRRLIGESQHLEASEMLNDSGYKHKESSLAQNADFDQELEARALSVAPRKFDLDENESSFTEIANNRAVFDVYTPDESTGKGEHEEEKDVTGQRNEDGKEEREKTENARHVRNGCNKTQSVVVKVACWKREESEEGHSEKYGRMIENRSKEEEGEHLLLKNGQNKGIRKETNEEDDVKEEERGYQQSADVEMMEARNEKILIGRVVYEEKRTCSATIRTKEESDGRDTEMEDLTKNGKDEENEEDINKIKYSVDFEAVKAVDEKNRQPQLKRRKHLTEQEATIKHHPGAATLKNDTDDINLTCRATSQSLR